ncbi:MAG: hypothetical protein K2G69_02130 [Muribaculaceae bacterium]|nr:hypothetical protein [Muribaculaceae bacterium]
MKLRVNFKRLHPDAVVPFKKHSDDYCYDCVATSVEQLAPNIYRYGLGFALQVDRKDRAIKIPVDKLLAIDVRPRSSVWETGMVLANSPGTCDEPYTGEYKVTFYHIFPEMPRYEVGDKVCQIKIGFTLPLEFVEVDGLEQTDRGDGGFGSTGR